MTVNQVNYLRAVNDFAIASQRAAEDARHNRTTEEVERAKQWELERHNKRAETIDWRNALFNRRNNYARNVETERHNRATENIDTAKVEAQYASIAAENERAANKLKSDWWVNYANIVSNEYKQDRELAWQREKFGQELNWDMSKFISDQNMRWNLGVLNAETSKYMSDNSLAGAKAAAAASMYSANKHYQASVDTAEINKSSHLEGITSEWDRRDQYQDAEFNYNQANMFTKGNIDAQLKQMWSWPMFFQGAGPALVRGAMGY